MHIGQSAVANRFGKAAQTYHDYADVQERAALVLAEDLRRITQNVPSGAVLELGCGTGFFSQQLLQNLGNRKLIVSDIAPEMVKICRSRIQSPNVTFAVLNAETSKHWSTQFALIASAFGAQWFNDLATTFDGIYDSLLPGGYFIFSVPTNKSFSEWKNLCAGENLQYTGNHLPDVTKFKAYWSQRTDSFEWRTVSIQSTYSTSIEFFRALKRIGATTSTRRTALGETWERRHPGGFSKLAGSQSSRDLPANHIASQNHSVNEMNPVYDATPNSSISTPGEDDYKKSVSNLRRIIKRWDSSASGPIVVTYEVMCGIVRRTG